MEEAAQRRGVGGGGPCREGLQLPLVLANRPLADPGFLGVRKTVLGVGGGFACSDNLYTSGPRPGRIFKLLPHIA